MNIILTNSYIELALRSWNEAIQLNNALKGFVFRGHSDCRWNLSSTLEREAARFNCPPEEVWKREKNILSRFKSRAHHFLKQSPLDNELIEWLSIIQDYGGPTRLLDFTESFYVASFFAIETTNANACIWAVNAARLLANSIGEHGINNEIGLVYEKMYDLFTLEIVKFAELYLADEKKEKNLVLAVNPPRLNDRLAVQKGLFLFPCDLRKSFEYNLCKTLNFSFESLDSSNAIQLTENIGEDLAQALGHASIIKIILPTSLHRQALSQLYQMNIDAASLFPGLDGFARSLKYYTHFTGLEFRILPGEDPDKTAKEATTFSPEE